MRIRRWLRGPAWAVVTLLGIAASADAQLFPNLPTRNRTRTDCALEKPVFGQYRHQYYGYYPTCWRRFPTGWGCPTPEAPNWEAELAKRPLDVPDQEAMRGLGEDLLGGDEGQDDPLGGGFNPPPLPRAGRSPFELDEPGAGVDGAGPGGANRPDDGPPPVRPRSEPPAIPPVDRGTGGDPFEAPAGPDPFDLPAPSGGASVPPTASLPEISPPGATPRTLEYQPGSDLAPPALAPPAAARILPISNESPSVHAGAMPPRANMMPPDAMISPAMGPRPGPRDPGMNGPMPGQIVGQIEGLPPGVVLDESGELVGTPVGVPGEYVEAPPSRPTGKLKGFVSNLLYGRGLRR